MATETWAVTMVKDEADVIEHSLRRMLTQVDGIIVADNGSADGTREILDRLPVQVIEDHEPGYYQSDKMSRLAQLAAEAGAEWVVPFDADEVWVSRERGGRVADTLAKLDVEEAIATAPILNHLATGEDDQEDPDPTKRIRWRLQAPLPLPKVACRPRLRATIAQGNHAAHYPAPGVVEHRLEVRHFPYRSADQFVSKVRNGAAAYNAADLPDDVGQHWREYGKLLDEQGEDAVRQWFHTHFYEGNPADRFDLMLDPCP